MPSPVEITLRDMRFHVRVGVLPHESEFAQPLHVDLSVWVTPVDRGTIALDYRALYAVVTGVLAHEPLRHLETIAADIVSGARANPVVLGARVAVRKPHVALGGPLACAEVIVHDGVCA